MLLDSYCAVNVRIARFNRNSFVIGASLHRCLAATRQSCLVKLETVLVMALLSKFVKFGHLFTDVIANVEFSFRGDDLIVLLVFQRFLANWIITDDFATLSFVLFDLGEAHDGRTVRTLYPERVNDLFDNT